MTAFSAAILNGYPRIGDAPSEQVLRRTLAKRDGGEASDADVLTAVESTAEAAIREQESAGLSPVTDGQVAWPDPVSHLLRGLDGFVLGGLIRWFDTNTYIRQPERTGRVRRRGPVTVAAFEHARRVAGRPVKAVLTGPWTLASHTRVADGGTEALARELVPSIAEEVRALAHAGATQIQIDEPSLTHEAALPDVVREAAASFAAGKGPSRLGLATYFGGVSALVPDLLALPVDFLAFDLVQGAASLPALRRARAPMTLYLGLVDARNTRLEDPAAVAGAARDVAQATGAAEVVVTTSNSLEFLPRGRARDKLAVLAKAAALAGGAP